MGKTRELFTEKAMAPHSSTLAWRVPWTGEPGGLQYMGLSRQEYWSVPWTGEPGGLQYMGSLRVRHN